MKKALQVASVASMIDQFNMPNINTLQELGYKVDVAANFEFGNTSSKERVEEFRKELKALDINIFNLSFNRKIFDKSNIHVYRQLKKIIDENNYEIIHCHSPIGGVITRLAARKARKKGTKVIYTAHGFHFFKGAPLINWLIYYPVEWICSWFTDVLITINQEDYAIAKKRFKARNIEYVDGVGVDTQKCKTITVDKVTKRAELGVPEHATVLLSVGELSKRKNHQVVIRALSQIGNKDIYYLVCGQGPMEKELKELSEQLNIRKQVIFTGFRRDIMEICKVVDIFVFPSLQEGLPLALMEAMGAGLPAICSNIRGNVDLIEDEKGGYLCNPKCEKEFEKAINKLEKNKVLSQEMGLNNKNKVVEFSVVAVKDKMQQIYMNPS